MAGKPGRVRRLILQLLVLAILPLLFALIWRSGKRPPPPVPLTGGAGASSSSGASHGQALKLPAKLPSGWALKGRLLRYDKKTLFDRINGAAPAYIRAGYVGSVGAEFAKKGFTDTVMVDLYDMGGAARALGMYATERDPSYSFSEVGDEGYLASGSLNLWSGRFYIKLAGFEEGPAMDAGLKELAVDLVKVLPEAVDLPAVKAGLALLPSAHQVPHGAGYSYAALADVEGLKGVFTARYKRGQGDDAVELSLFALQEKGEAQAGARLAAARKYFEGYEAEVGASEEQGGSWLTVKGQGASHLLVRRGALIGGALDLTSEAQLAAARALLAGLGAAPTAAGADKP